MLTRLSTLLAGLRLDLRHATRSLISTPGFVLVGVLSLALGIACATIFFSFSSTLLGRGAPHVAEQHELVAIHQAEPNGSYGALSYPDMVDIREQIAGLADAAAVHHGELSVGVLPGSERTIPVEEVSENYFDLLGVPMALGRGFMAEDAGTSWQVAVVSHRMWQRELGGVPDVLGRTIRVNGRPFTIVGVAPEGLQGWEAPFLLEIWVPLGQAWRSSRGMRGLTVVGRMRPDVGLEQLRAQLIVLGSSLAETYPSHWHDHNDRSSSVAALPHRQRGLLPQHQAQVAVVSLGVATAIGLLLLVACSNVANLQLTRALRRRREIAVRLALGAGRRRLVRQLLLESLLIASLAGGLGLLVTHWFTGLLSKGSGAINLPVALDIAIDFRVVLFTVVLAVGVAIAFGLAPAMQASRPDLVTALKGLEEGGKKGKLGMRRVLIVAQVAGSLVLVVAATLLLRSLQAVQRADFGFRPESVVLLTFDLSHRQHSRESGLQFLETLCQRLASVSGVRDVAAACTVALGNVMIRTLIEAADDLPSDAQPLPARLNLVTPGYFEVVGMPVLRGRGFTDSDSESGVAVAVVNQTLAERLWAEEDPIGKRLKYEEWVQVVGVVRDATTFQLNEGREPHLWRPHAQHYSPRVTVHVATSGDPGALLPTLRQELLTLDGELPILHADLMEEVVALKSAPQRVTSALLGAAGAVTTGLAMMGVYGVMAFLVGRRTREMGIRLALGAQPERLLRMVLREGLGLTAVGVAAGTAIMLVLAPLLRVVLYRVSPVDPLAYLGGVGLLLLAAVAACLAPALRAARVDPAASLRAE